MNRKRPVVKTAYIKVWCSPEEKAKLREKAKFCHLKLSPFLVALGCDYEIFVPQLPQNLRDELRSRSILLSHVVGYFNQITAAINAGKISNARELDLILRQYQPCLETTKEEMDLIERLLKEKKKGGVSVVPR